MQDDLLGLAAAAARAAGALLLERFDSPRTGVGTKSSGTDMVSDADRAAEALIRDSIRSSRPDDSVLGEEGGAVRGTSGIRWVIDPLDGTTNFLYGIPHWSVSIACEDTEGLVAGVVLDASRNELFAARRGGGATRNGEPIVTSALRDLSRALVATGFSYRADERAAEAAMLREILPGVRDIRRAGTASLDLAFVACGRVDGYFETPIEWWDVSAGILLVREAGGRTGEIPSVGPAGIGVIAAGPGIYDELRALVTASLATRA